MFSRDKYKFDPDVKINRNKILFADFAQHLTGVNFENNILSLKNVSTLQFLNKIIFLQTQ